VRLGMSKPIDSSAQIANVSLFEDLPEASQAQVLHAQPGYAAAAGAQPLADRLRASDLESLLAEDHRARLVWGYVVCQDLSKLVEAVKVLVLGERA
jgi:hypothetical protein